VLYILRLNVIAVVCTFIIIYFCWAIRYFLSLVDFVVIGLQIQTSSKVFFGGNFKFLFSLVYFHFGFI